MLQVVACLGVSEPGGGSDVAACQTTARRVGDDLVINGQKMWITNAFQADWICLLANTEEGPGECVVKILIISMNLETLLRLVLILNIVITKFFMLN